METHIGTASALAETKRCHRTKPPVPEPLRPVTQRLKLAAKQASNDCTSLRGKVVTPHIVRHTTAMLLLQAGVDLSVIALWLGHESVTTTHHYLEADLKMKEQALAVLQPPALSKKRFKPSNDVLAFLDAL